ncbi:MAG: thioredoxin domain-containing protein [Candidatus Jordarchaeum sp.]|uniref:thioredoxin domain-containing protein n=1 Tax=Candidatus Jordarchaeum sp. TaxID=2823881 RepID=UPI00404AC816
MADKSKERNPNKLILEKSPYLMQHAYNPVDWYPWGEEAFERAKKKDKPIFLSIGYSTCHWCHVMEKESFEDPEVARLMNENFVSIKVDREERPDIDDVYMTVCQMMTGTGGWPLTIIMTPDKKPFFAGTYIPKESRFGLTGMKSLVPRIKEFWEKRRKEVENSADQIIKSIRDASREMPGEELGEEILHRCYENLYDVFDEQNGGFGHGRKFPTPHNLTFLLRYWKRTGDGWALRMVEKTLQAMRLGGIYDHVGFGFHRYSVDNQWLVPHFEKMLYDQAMLVTAYTDAYQATGKEEYAQTVQEILTYVLRDMTAPEGGFYSAEDADSEGEEGKFYLWTEEEIRQILSGEEAETVIKIYNIYKEGNFEDEASRKKTGKNIFHLKKPLPEIISDLQMPLEETSELLEKARQKLFLEREKRVHPQKDDKILTDWNGLMIAALAKAAQVFQNPQYLNAAEKAMDFILQEMRNSEGRLCHRYREGDTAILGFLDDYAFLIYGLIELYETNFEVKYLREAITLTGEMIKHFWDDENGGFYFTADDAENILIRKKEIYDGAYPSGNSIAMLDLLSLGRLTSNPEYEEKSAQIMRTFSRTVSRTPMGYTQLMVGLDFALGPSFEVVIAGNTKTDDTKTMLRALREKFIPNKVVLFVPSDVKSPEITGIAEFTKNQKSIEGKATAYVCQNYACKSPTTDIGKMLEFLNV